MKHKNGVYSEVVSWENGRKKKLFPSAEIEHAMHVADALSKAICECEIIITAIFDGKHMTGSKHYNGNAFDMRKWIFTPSQLNQFLTDLRANLGPDYDVVEEETHIHIEYDPKNVKKK